jgi:diguanylate cyclase (GGDEF)-like protein
MREVNLQRKRLYVILVLLLIVAFLATISLSYWVARDTIRNNIVDAELPLTGDSIYSEIQRDIIKPVFVSDQMAHNTFLLDWIVAGESDTDAVVRYLSEIKKRYGAITSFFISEKTRKYFNADGFHKTVLESEPRDQWYFRVRAMKEPYEINFDPDDANRNRLTAFINFRVLNNKGEFQGVTGVGLSSNAIAELVKQYESKFKRRIAFYDQKGKQVLAAVGDPDGGANMRDQPGIATISTQILNASNVQTKLSYTNAESSSLTHVNSRYVPELKWYLVISQDEREALSPLGRVFALNLLIGTIATLAALALVLWTVARFQNRLAHLASTDALTGLPNRSSGESALRKRLSEASDNKSPMSLLVIDIDRFKRINDEHGHLVGDRVIEAIAKLIRANTRESDIVSRWGGEEFVVLLPNTVIHDAAKRAEMLRSAIESCAIEVGETAFRETISVGVAQWNNNENDQNLFARADRALIQAKQAGRNRVATA